MKVSAYPLQWPGEQPRRPAHERERSRFSTTLSSARDSLIRELRLMGIDTNAIIISSNVPVRKDGFPMASVRRVDDPAVACYFEREGRTLCIACDRWERVEDNMQAIRKSVESIRGLARWGTSQMVDTAFAGFEALPESASGARWWEVLDVAPDASQEEIERAYRRAMKRSHPDVGGTNEDFHRVQQAFLKAVEV